MRACPKGGLVDFLAEHPNPNSADRPWQTPHSSHRLGTGIDVNKPGGQSYAEYVSPESS